MTPGEYKPCMVIINEKERIKRHCNYLLSKLNKCVKKSLSSMTLLDIGCGNGFYLFGLSDHFKEITGLDPSDEMLRLARNNNKKYFHKNNIQFHKGSVENNSLKIKFDIILFSYSLHFTKDSYNSLDIMSKNLNKGGIFVIIEPNKEFIGTKLIMGHKDFDQKYYDEKQLLLEKTRSNVNKFTQNCNILYQEFNEKHFILIFNFIL